MKRLVDAETGELLIAGLEVADRFWPRFVGLQFRRSLPADGGVLLSPCSSIHTCFMRFPIDVIMLDREMCVVSVKRNIRPWRAVVCAKGTSMVLETIANAREWSVGQKLRIE